ncbi:MAG: tetraacyldisaccharide 4'-kinase, partial [Mangrovicoccus sp.]
MAVLQELSARGKRPFVISRGYGGSLEGPHLVRPEDLATQVGDEPLLLSAFAPVVIGKDRAAAAKLALDHGADILVMDDGFQNPSLAKDLSLVVVDAAKGFGNGRCLPAGPLREAVSPGLARADLLVSLGDGQAQSQLDQNWGPEIKDLPRLCASLEPLQMGYDWTGTRALAFAGIGRPEKFFATLRSLNVELVQTVALGDHQPINDTLFARLKREAA